MKDKDKTKSEGKLKDSGDVTGRVDTEKELQRLSQFRENIIESANVWLDVLDREENVVVWNRAAEKISGYSNKEVIGHDKIWEWLYPDKEYRKIITEKAAAIIQRREAVEDFETTIRCKDGHQRIISWNSHSLLDENGNFIGSIALGRDITERKRAEEALQESEKRFRNLFENSPDAIFVEDLNGKVLDVNPAACILHGKKRDELINSHIHELIPPDNREEADRDFTRLAKGEIDYLEGFSLTSDGVSIPVEVRASKIEYSGKPALLLHVRDITVRKIMERNLVESNLKYQNLYDHAPDMYFTVSPDGTIISVNQFGAEYLGYSKDELIGKSVWTIVYKDDLKKIKRQIAKIFSQKLLKSELEFRKVRKDGTILWVHERTRLLLDENEMPAMLHIICRDISDRKQAQELLRYKELFDNVADGVFILSFEKRFVEINDRLSEMTGYSRDELITRTFNNIVEKKQMPYIENILEKIKNEKHGNFEFDLKTDRGVLIPVAVNCRVISYLENDSILGVVRNITQMKFLQEQLIRSERLAATGQLAASIAHEINSPLQAVTVMIGMVKNKYGKEKELSAYMDTMKRAFNNISNTIKNLMDLNRPGKEVKQPVNVNKIIEKTVELVNGHLKNNKVKIKLTLSSNVPVITASPQQLGQVFLNIINNAVEAMTGISKSQEGWKSRTAPGGELKFETLREGDNIIINVSDSGPGIPKEDLGHIFDPFYTRKKKFGMGIGLSICNGIIEDHNGTIIVKNSEDGGAVLKIILPVD